MTSENTIRQDEEKAVIELARQYFHDPSPERFRAWHDARAERLVRLMLDGAAQHKCRSERRGACSAARTRSATALRTPEARKSRETPHQGVGD